MTTVQAGPWGSEHPVIWAMNAGKITASTAPGWLSAYVNDPAGVGRTLASLAPVVGHLNRLAVLERDIARIAASGTGDDEEDFSYLFRPTRSAVDDYDGEDFTHLFPAG